MYRVAEGIRSAHGQDGAVVLDVRQGQVFNLNPAGARILSLLEAGSSEPAIVDAICEQFQMSRETVESDVREFLASLEQHHLLEDSQANGKA
jgi:PqqD family protein of HPr-rel-A system